MKKEKRLEETIKKLKAADAPIPGSDLAGFFKVSRQIIVSDIAELKRQGYEIFSTNRGYLLQEVKKPQRVFKVRHLQDEIHDELLTIVVMGGKILDVFVVHDIYGMIRADLNIGSEAGVEAFVTGLSDGEVSPLMKLTDAFHYHTVEAEDEITLAKIEQRLKEKNYLVI
ncbi:transcription repressor NadR [Eubacteriaceae bacterium ES3]|nr:transcription repressor NadR [Eubacteriaceae bacterium ES3]